MPIVPFLGGLGAGLTGFTQANLQQDDARLRLQLLGQELRQRQAAMQQQQEQQSSLPLIYKALQGGGPFPGGFSPPSPQAPLMTGGALPNVAAGQPAPDPQMQAAQRLLAAGYPPAAAAGIVGGLTGESGRNLNPLAVNPAGNSIGMAQWTGPRRQALQQRPDWQSPETQINFLTQEMAPGGPEARTGEALRSFQGTPQQAADLFTTGNLRPGIPNLPAREQSAAQIYQSLGGPEAQQQAQPISNQIASSVPPGASGFASLQRLAQRIEQIAPEGTPDNVKAMALIQLQQLLAPTEKAELQAQLNFMREQFMFQRSEQAGWTPIQLPDGKVGRMNTRTGEVQEVPAAAGATKLGTKPGGSQPLTDAAAERYAKIFEQSGYLPPGIARSSAAIAQIMNKTGDTGTPGDFVANMATRQADTKSLANMTKMADAATSFENTAIRNFDQALKYGEQLKRTDMGPWLNKWVMTGETAVGDPTAPAYVTALITAANEYAKVMSGATGAQGSTVDARREAAELFSPYLAKGQIEEVVRVAKAEMENRREELYAGVDDIKNRLRQPPTTTMSRGHEPGATAAPQEGMPVPAEHQNDPDGTTYNNGQYIKRGNRIIPQDAGGAAANPRP